VHDYDDSTHEYEPDAFNDSGKGNARFSPLMEPFDSADAADPLAPAVGPVIPTLYAADSPRGAIAEIVLRTVPTPSAGHIHDWTADRNSKMHISEIALAPLRLANLKSTGLKAAGLKHEDVFAGMAANYPRTRELAQHVWKTLPEAQGLIWMSVQANESAVIMLFGDRIDPQDVHPTGLCEPIEVVEDDVLELLDELGCGAV
jgi:hypothetical protein